MFDKANVGIIHKDIIDALQAVAKKHNLTLSPSRVTYSDATFSFKAEFGSNEATGGADPILYNDMKKNGFRFGLTVDDIGKSFKMGADTFKIEGMRSTKVIGSRDGSKYKFEGRHVIAGLIK